MATPKDTIGQPLFTGTPGLVVDAMRDVFSKYPGPLPAHVAQRPDYLGGPLSGSITNALFPGANVANQDYPTPDPQVRFNVEIVENGYVLKAGGRVFICEDINKVGERVVALLAAKQMDAK